MTQVDTTVLGLDAKRAKEMPYIASMGIYVVSKEAMISLLRNDFPEANDFGSEVIPGATAMGMNVRAFSQVFLLRVYSGLLIYLGCSSEFLEFRDRSILASL